MLNRILHVEDNDEDAVLVKMAFRKAGLSVQIDLVTDGDMAIATLGACSDLNLPHCVLLDIKLPGKSGLEVLAWIRTQPRFRRLPVVMLTSSDLVEDVNAAYDLGANSYLGKPSDLDSLTSMARTIYHYWFQANTAPTITITEPAQKVMGLATA